MTTEALCMWGDGGGGLQRPQAQRLMAGREQLEVLVMQLSHPWWPVVDSALRALGSLAHNHVAARHSAIASHTCVCGTAAC